MKKERKVLVASVNAIKTHYMRHKRYGIVAFIDFVEVERINGTFIHLIGANHVSPTVPIHSLSKSELMTCDPYIIGNPDEHIDPVTWLSIVAASKCSEDDIALLDKVCADIASLYSDRPYQHVRQLFSYDEAIPLEMYN